MSGSKARPFHPGSATTSPRGARPFHPGNWSYPQAKARLLHPSVSAWKSWGAGPTLLADLVLDPGFDEGSEMRVGVGALYLILGPPLIEVL